MLRVDRLPCSDRVAGLLCVAAMLAEGGPVDRCDVGCGLDSHSLRLVATAVLHAGGHRSATASLGPGQGAARGTRW